MCIVLLRMIPKTLFKSYKFILQHFEQNINY